VAGERLRASVTLGLAASGSVRDQNL
jgi:hypothetical protein